jgi:hypothetical protein
VQPSSLVFMAIVAVWALYVVRSLVRRRVMLAESRTADRFSAGLRVLARRSRSAAAAHRSGESVLSSPRLVVDSDGELLYIPGDKKPAPPKPAPARLGTLDIAIMTSRIAARRRARIMAVLLLATVSTWGIAVSVPAAPFWVALPATLLLVLHGMASRAAGLRSREHLSWLARELSAPEARPRPVARPVAAPPVVAPAPVVPERVARRQAAVGAETWNPVPVPPPTYTLKPHAPRPEPAPLDLPAAAAVSRAALPRTAADIERILALDPNAEDERKVVNG